MDNVYRLVGVEVAMQLLRPGAKSWELTNNKITKWNDVRPCPTWEELVDVIHKIKDFEDSIKDKTMWLPEQLEKIQQQHSAINKALNASS